MATHSSTLAWKIPWTEDPGRLQRGQLWQGSKESDTTVTEHSTAECHLVIVIRTGLQVPWASLVAQEVKRLSTMWETWVLSLGREDPLEKELANHSSTLA